MQSYCVKCRTKREIKDPTSITMKNGKPSTQGICPVCATKMFRIGGGTTYRDNEDNVGVQVPQATISEQYYYTGELKPLSVFIGVIVNVFVIILLISWGASWLFTGETFLYEGIARENKRG